MERNMDLIREIMLQVEQSNEDPRGWVDIEVEGFSNQQISYHVKLLENAGLLEAHDLSSMDGILWRPSCLTWEGHEFIDATKNDTVWKRTKGWINEKGGNVPFLVVKDMAIEVAKKHFIGE